jgi:ER degradation enhancer, mannosidase alpha-like 2
MRMNLPRLRQKTLAAAVVCIALTLMIERPKVSAQSTSKQQLAEQVRAEFLHAWQGYKKYAWGHDDLKPLSKTYHDWYGEPLLMTPVDALDTMILMGLKDEAKATREYIATNLSFDKDIYVQNFEITIRVLGGLLSNYELTGDKRLLNLAEDLGNRLLPVFESPTGLPYRYVNLKTGKVRGNVTNPAEAGTLLIEFGTLAKLTRKQVFYEKAKRALVEIYQRRSPIGLVGTWINVETGQWTDTDSHISGAIDSYYEYLLKSAILFDDQDCKKMWDDSLAAINKYLSDEIRRENLSFVGRIPYSELWYGHADMKSGKRTTTTYGALDAFFPAVLALSGDFDHATRLQVSSFLMWDRNEIEPEEVNYQTMEVVSPGYPLRPEIVESTYYLYHFATNGRILGLGENQKFPQPTRRTLEAMASFYANAAEKIWKSFVRYCRTDDAYAALNSVITKEKSDSMQSFLFAETFKYFYLIFASPKTLNFDKVIFNTEAHPLQRRFP